MDWRARMAVLAAALWWGSLSVIGPLAVPLLFAHLPTAALAGNTAAKLFAAQTWVALACGMVLLLAARTAEGPASRMDWGRGALVFVVAGMLLALLMEFAVAPRITLRENLRLWHTLGTAMYAAQWLAALVVLCKLTAGPAPGAAPVSPGGPS